MTCRACRLCGEPLSRPFVDLGTSPLSNSYLSAEQLDDPEPHFPLCVYVCQGCLLVQLPEHQPAERIFTEYAYLSSYSESWLEHARRFTAMACERFEIGESHRVVELASNDGYLLRHFRERGVPVLGIEPARNVARIAVEAGIPTVPEFFGVALARRLVAEGTRADLIVGNNVLAHVPDLNDFVAGMKHLLAPAGVVSLEFPHLWRLIGGNQFDTIYHEHFSYFSFHTARRALERHGLAVFDVEQLPTHGGSLRVLAGHAGGPRDRATERVAALLQEEQAAGLCELEGHRQFSERVQATKRRLLAFLIRARDEGRTVAGYGAPAKGNTLLNYCGIRTDLLTYTVDRNPLKQGRFLPGTRIPIHAPERLRETRPDYVLILPWNLRDEIATSIGWIREWGGRFVVPIPELEVLE